MASKLPPLPTAGRLSSPEGEPVFSSDISIGAGGLGWFLVFAVFALAGVIVLSLTVTPGASSLPAVFGFVAGNELLATALVVASAGLLAVAGFSFIKLTDRRAWLVVGKAGLNLPRHSDFMYAWEDFSSASIEKIGGREYLCLKLVNPERGLGRVAPGKPRQQAQALCEKAGFAALAIPVRFPLVRSDLQSAAALIKLRLDKRAKSTA